MPKKKVTVAPNAASLRKRHGAAVAALFQTWLDMAEAALSEPSVSPSAPHVRIAIAATAGIPMVCWLQADNTVGWKIAMPIYIKKADDGKSWDVLFIDPELAKRAEAAPKTIEEAKERVNAPISIDLNKV